MQYLDSYNKVIDDTSKVGVKKEVESTEVSQQKELEEQPNTLVEQQLQAKQDIKAARKAKEKKVPWWKKSVGGDRMGMTDKIMLLDNLSTMLKAGLALAPALGTLSHEMKNKQVRLMLDHIRERIENGELLSDGMKQYPRAFPDMIVATVEVGEASGLLSDTLAHIADILKAEKALRSKVISAVMYPIVVVLALIGVSFVLAFSVFPKLIGIFEEAGVALPFILVAVNTTTTVFQEYWYIVTIAGLGIISALWFIFRHEKPKLALHSFLLRLPFVGGVIQEIQLTRLTGNLQVLLKSGLPIIKSITIIAKTLGNRRYRKTVLQIATELEKGVSLHESMARRPKLFPSLTIQLVQVGEETGELEEILGKVSEFYENRVNSVLGNLSIIIEPVLLIVVGIVVGFIAVSVIGPIYELTNSFSE